MNADKLKQYFHDPDEKLIAVLGQDYITSLLQGNLSKSIMFLTNKRLYQKGKIFTQSSSGKYISMAGERVCSIKDIIGTSFFELNKTPLLINCWVFSIIAIIGIANGFDESFTNLLPKIGIYSGLFAIAFWFSFFFGRRKLFSVQHAGGFIATEARWYSEQELHNFSVEISLTKESINNKNS